MFLIIISPFYTSILIFWIQIALSLDIMNVVHFIPESATFYLKKSKQLTRENKNHPFACCLVGITMELGSFCWLASLPEDPGSLILMGNQYGEHLSLYWPEDNPSHV